MMAVARLRFGPAARVLSLAVAALFALAGAPVHAQVPLPPPIVSWDVPEECPNALSIVQRLMTLAPGDPHAFDDAGTVRGAIVKDANEWVLALRIVEAGRVISEPTPGRVLRARDCDELADAAAVAIAIALGGAPEEPSPLGGETVRRGRFAPARATRSGRSQPRAAETDAPARAVGVSPIAHAATEPSPSAEAQGSPAADDPVPPDAERPAPEEPMPSPRKGGGRFGFVPSLELMLDTTSLGGAAFGPSAQAELRWGSVGVGAYGLWLPSHQIPVAQSQYVKFSLLSAGLRGCYRAFRGPPLLDVCAGGEFGALEAGGQGLLETSRRRDPWGAGFAGFLLGVDLSASLRAGARIEAVLPMSRERYLVNRDQAVHQVPPVSARLGVTLSGAIGAR